MAEYKALLTYATDYFNDEDNPRIEWKLPAINIDTLQACISISQNSEEVPFREIDKMAGSYTFNLTENERKALRAAMPTTHERIYFRLKTTLYTGEVYEDSFIRNFNLINSAPELTPNVTAYDERTKELTGDSTGGTIIRYGSDITFNVGAYARKEATIKDRTIICGSKTINNYDKNVGIIKSIESNTFYFSVTDSRGSVTKKSVVFSEDNGKFIPYVKLTNTIKEAWLSTTGELTFTVTGQYFSGSFGAKANTMKIDVGYRENGGDYTWLLMGTISPIIEGNTYTYTHTITGLNQESTYQLEVRVIDEISPVAAATTVVASVPIFDWSKRDFNFNVPVYLNGSNIPLENLFDYVIEQDTYSTWFYRKWYSGKVELYGYQNISDVACTAALGNMYRTAVITPPDFPFTVYSPKMVATYESEGYGAFLWPTTLTTTAKPANYYLVSPTSSAAITGKVNFHVQGSWK